jgi:hypothetical protein
MSDQSGKTALLLRITSVFSKQRWIYQTACLLSKLEEHLDLDEAATVAEENGASDIDSKTICSNDSEESTGHCEHNFKHFRMVFNINTVIITKEIRINVYRVGINYQRISLRRNLSRKCRKIVKFVSIILSEPNIWNGPIVATVISRKKK